MPGGMTAPDLSRFNLAAHVLAAGAQATPDKVALAILTLTGAERWSYGRLTRRRPRRRRLAAGAGHAAGRAGADPAGQYPGLSGALSRRDRRRAGAGRHLAAADGGRDWPDGGAGPPAADRSRPPASRCRTGRCPCPRICRAGRRMPPCDWHLGDAGREGYVVFTSGTSGRPLAVRHAHRAILARALMHQGWEGIGPSDRLLHAGAFNWTYTMGTGLLDPWTVGATALIAGALGQRWNICRWCCAATMPHILAGVPTVFPPASARRDAGPAAPAPCAFRRRGPAPRPSGRLAGAHRHRHPRGAGDERRFRPSSRAARRAPRPPAPPAFPSPAAALPCWSPRASPCPRERSAAGGLDRRPRPDAVLPGRHTPPSGDWFAHRRHGATRAGTAPSTTTAAPTR
jgi:hypothetical protein